MKIAIIIPTNNWLNRLIPELADKRNDVLVNECSEDADLIISTSHTQWEITKELHEKYPDIPLIVWNWDWFDCVDKSRVDWREYIKLMKESVVWSADKYTAEITEKDTGIKSYNYFYGFINPDEWGGENNDWGYIMMGSRKDPNKRFDWFIRAASELGIPYKAYHPEINSRRDYIRTLKNCSFLVMASREESIGGLTPMEAAYNKKPILVSDYPSCKEVWGDDAVYFKRHDFDDFKKQMKWLWENRNSKEIKKKVENAYKRVNQRFLPEHMADLITNVNLAEIQKIYRDIRNKK